jgi:exopolysaccharide biosynthesis polyprenyl glycosylphosphotransferase
MLREKEKTFVFLFSFFDIIITLFSLSVAYAIRMGENILASNREYIILYLFSIGIWYLVTKTFHIHYLQRIRSFAGIFVDYLLIYIVCLAFLFFVIFVLKLREVNRAVFVIFAILNFILLYSFKMLVSKTFDYFRSKGYNSRNAIIIADHHAGYCIEKLLHSHHTGLIIKGIITDSKEIKRRFSDRVDFLPADINIAKLMEDDPIDELFYCKSDLKENELREIIYQCEEIGVILRINSTLYNMISSKTKIYYLDEVAFTTMSSLPDHYAALLVKRLMDIVISLFALIVASPFLIIIALMIKFTSHGPVFYKQTRTGLRGREFTLYKFRSMVANSDALRDELQEFNEMEGPVFKIKNDPRITKIGRFLRKTSLDEFPQFWNVLKNEMSVVGPRPPLPSEVKQYKRWQLRRISMKPGITCIWQVSGRNDTSFDEWMWMDLEYIDNWSLKLDLLLCLQTIKTVVKMNGH